MNAQTVSLKKVSKPTLIAASPRKYRRPNDIKADILKMTIKGATITPILFSCNLSYKLGRKYIQVLIDGKLLVFRKVDGRKTFFTTEKGEKWLGLYLELKKANNKRAFLNKKTEGLAEQLRGIEGNKKRKRLK